MLETEFTVFWIGKFYEYAPGWIAAAVSAAIILVLGRWLHSRYGGYLAGYCILFFIVYFCPVSAYVIANWCIEELVYWRMLWLFPMTVLVGYAAGLVYGKIKKKIWKTNIVLMMCLLVIGSGTCIYGWGDYEFVANAYKIPQNVIDACDIILENTEEEQPLAVGDYDFSCYSRLYNADILQPYGRYQAANETAEQLRVEYSNKEAPDVNIIIEKSTALNVDFIVFYKNVSPEIFFQSGYEAVGETEEYVVYMRQV